MRKGHEEVKSGHDSDYHVMSATCATVGLSEEKMLKQRAEHEGKVYGTAAILCYVCGVGVQSMGVSRGHKDNHATVMA